MKYKVALLCNGFGSVHRGAERLTQDIYDVLKDTYDIQIFSAVDTGTKRRKDFRIPWRNGKAYLEAYHFGKAWYHQNKKKHFDLIINNTGFIGSYWCNKYRKHTSTPFITLERGGGKEELINFFFKPDCIVFFTKTSERNSKKWFLPTVRTTTIPIGIYPHKFRGSPSSMYTKGMERPIILSTSALVPFKRVDLIIDTINLLGKGSMIQTSEGMLEEKIVKKGEELLGNRFIYIGTISREEIIKLYNSCNVFVNASRKEAFGIVYLEAMASGLPIVTQDDKRRREIIGDAGEFVDCSNIQEFANAIDNATKNTYNSQEQIKRYDWKTVKQQYINLIDGLIE